MLDVRQVVAAVPTARLRRRRSQPTSARIRSTARSRAATSSYATAAEGQDFGEVERAVDEEMARFLATGRRAPSSIACAPSSRARSSAASSKSAASAASRTSSPRTPVFGGRPDFYKRLARRDERRDARAGARGRAPAGSRGNALALEVRPFPTTLAADKDGADRTEIPKPTSFPDAPFPALAQSDARERTARSSSPSATRCRSCS